MAKNVNHILLAALVLGHMAVDLNQGALPALLPSLKESLQLSYTQAAAILMTMTFSSSIIQPLFGYFSDRFRTRWMLPTGVIMAGVAFACLGLATSYLQIMLIVFISGLGVAAYHPEGAKGALGTSKRRVVAMSWFMLGGNTGFALGPVAVMACVTLLGHPGIMLFAVPALAIGLWVSRMLSKNHASQALAAAAAPPPQPIAGRLRPMALLLASVIFRSSVQMGFTIFMPFYLTSHMGWDTLDIAPMLTFYLIVGSMGTMLGGQLGQKLGPKRFFLLSVILVTPFNFLFLQAYSNLWLLVWLGLSAACLMAPWSSMLVMAQDIMPDRSGMASALMVGFSIGSGGLCATLMGVLADHAGVLSVMWLLVFLPLASAVLGALVPKKEETPACPQQTSP